MLQREPGAICCCACCCPCETCSDSSAANRSLSALHAIARRQDKFLIAQAHCGTRCLKSSNQCLSRPCGQLQRDTKGGPTAALLFRGCAIGSCAVAVGDAPSPAAAGV